MLIDYTYTDLDGDHRGRGIYDVIWRTKGGIPPLGRSLKITDFRLRRQGGTQAEIDALWAVPAA